MRKLSIVLFLLVTVSLSSFAGNPVNNYPAFKGMEHFMRTFPQATEVDCKNKGEFTEVNFIWKGLQLQAFYDQEGNPVATSRQISIDNLPLTVQIMLKDKYPGFIATTAIEFDDNTAGLSYYVAAAGPKTSYLLHVSTDGNISVFKKMRN
jgi:hypothetical protein